MTFFLNPRWPLAGLLVSTAIFTTAPHSRAGAVYSVNSLVMLELTGVNDSNGPLATLAPGLSVNAQGVTRAEEATYEPAGTAFADASIGSDDDGPLEIGEKFILYTELSGYTSATPGDAFSRILSNIVFQVANDDPSETYEFFFKLHYSWGQSVAADTAYDFALTGLSLSVGSEALDQTYYEGGNDYLAPPAADYLDSGDVEFSIAAAPGARFDVTVFNDSYGIASSAAAVPEPGSVVMAVLGLLGTAGFVAARRLRQRV